MSERDRRRDSGRGSADSTAAAARAPGKRTLSERRYGHRAAAPGTDGVIQRQEVAGGACLDPDAVLADLRRIEAEAAAIAPLIDPDGAGAPGVAMAADLPNQLRALTHQLEVLAPAIDGCSAPLLHGQLARARDQAEDAVLAAFQTLAAYHADQTLRSWSNASDDDQANQRHAYHQESGHLPDDTDWCGMFANAQYRAAGMSGALNMTFNSTFHVREFFRYGTGSNNSPSEIQVRGAGDPMALRAYHEQRGSLRSWLEGPAIGDDVRPGDIVTIDWLDRGDSEDHITVVRSYTPDTGLLITIDGNSFGARKPGLANPDFGSLSPGDDMNALSPEATGTDVGTSQYQAGAGGEREVADGAGPAFNRDAMLDGHDANVAHAMTMVGRGRPSLVDFETEHVYPGYSGPNAAGPPQPGGPIQRSERAAVTAVDPGAAFAAATTGSPGEVPYRDEMQARFGADFSSVRAFVGRDLEALGAHAATRESTVAFASTAPDEETVAHELTHVLQARGGGTRGGGVSDPADGSEHEARAVAAQFSAGGPLTVAGAPSARIHRQERTPVPPAIQPPAADGHQSGRLDWDGFHGINMTPDDGPSADSIREIYAYYLLVELRRQFPAECAADGGIPDDSERGPDAVAARARAVVRLGGLMRNAMVALQRAGDLPGAEAMRVRLFVTNQHALVRALQVEASTRYRKPNATKTWCNIYAYDVVTALGGYLPRRWWRDIAIAAIQAGAQVVTDATYRKMRQNQPDGDLRVVANNDVFTEQVNANAMTRWMTDWGATQFGWQQVPDARGAQTTANGGHLVIILARNVDEAKSGHVSVVLAENDQHVHPPDTADGEYLPLQSQAGFSNFQTNDGEAAVGTNGRRAWWAEPEHVDAGFWAYLGAPQAQLAIQPPDRLGTVLPNAQVDPHPGGAGR